MRTVGAGGWKLVKDGLMRIWVNEGVEGRGK